MKSCRSPHIVSYVTSFVHRHQLWVVMELAEGGSVDILLRHHGSLPEEACAIITADVLCGLAYLHTNGIAHNDVKPANMLLTSEGRCKLCDFGVARRVFQAWHDGDELRAQDSCKKSGKGGDGPKISCSSAGEKGKGGAQDEEAGECRADDGEEEEEEEEEEKDTRYGIMHMRFDEPNAGQCLPARTASGHKSAKMKERRKTERILGTMLYCSPEMLLRNGAGVKSDVWSLGISLMEMVLGKHVFHGHSRQSVCICPYTYIFTLALS